MAEFNELQRELSLKIVYCGPSASGKTTNLEMLSQMAPREACGKLIRLASRAGFTALCDRLLLCTRLKTEDGRSLKVKLKIFTAPGQDRFHFTRKALLKDADAVVFVADGRANGNFENQKSLHDLHQLLLSGVLKKDLPIVIQCNKNDQGDERILNMLKAHHQVFQAVALQGRGVRETLEGLLKICWSQIRERWAPMLDETSFVNQLFEGFQK